MKQALIIFARKPEKGKVKTRLAAQIGDEHALAIYIKLLEHTRDVTRKHPCQKYVFLTDTCADGFWAGFHMEKQSGGDLGDRMSHAFQLLFAKGYQQVVIIGSDCPSLTAALIHSAFNALQDADVVVGPATDGGYYLLGMKEHYPAIFQNKSWSTETVFAETVASLNALGCTFSLLASLTDVDEASDLPVEWLEYIG